jgi:hypothetical protein
MFSRAPDLYERIRDPEDPRSEDDAKRGPEADAAERFEPAAEWAAACKQGQAPNTPYVFRHIERLRRMYAPIALGWASVRECPEKPRSAVYPDLGGEGCDSALDATMLPASS